MSLFNVMFTGTSQILQFLLFVPNTFFFILGLIGPIIKYAGVNYKINKQNNDKH